MVVRVVVRVVVKVVVRVVVKVVVRVVVRGVVKVLVSGLSEGGYWLGLTGLISEESAAEAFSFLSLSLLLLSLLHLKRLYEIERFTRERLAPLLGICFEAEIAEVELGDRAQPDRQRLRRLQPPRL